MSCHRGSLLCSKDQISGRLKLTLLCVGYSELFTFCVCLHAVVIRHACTVYPIPMATGSGYVMVINVMLIDDARLLMSDIKSGKWFQSIEAGNSFNSLVFTLLHVCVRACDFPHTILIRLDSFLKLALVIK